MIVIKKIDKKQVFELVKQGLSDSRIGEKLGASKQGIQRIRSEAEFVNRVKTLLDQLVAIANKFHLSEREFNQAALDSLDWLQNWVNQRLDL